MSKKGILAAAKKLEEYYAQFPDWYWKTGLHDAVVLSVSTLQLYPDYKSKDRKYNCLELQLDSKGAMFESDVKKISLYNYRITCQKMNATEEIVLDDFRNKFWLGDELKTLDNGKYELEIKFSDLKYNLLYLSVIFESAEVERK